MEEIKKIENVVAGWHQKLPHMSTNARQWLANNIWWIVLIAAVLQGAAIFGALMMLLVVNGFLRGVMGLYLFGVEPSSLMTFTAFLSLILYIINLILMIVAITPLRHKLKKGWTLLFIVMLINAVPVVLDLIWSFDVGSFVINAMFIAVLVYFLFEIRHLFKNRQAKQKAVSSGK